MTDSFPIIRQFEHDLKNKISFKQSSKISPQNLLMKTFKFFDLYMTGFVNENEFFRALTKVGVVVSNPQHMTYIFQNYDFDHDGKINYRQFVDFFLKSKQQSSELNESYISHTSKPSRSSKQQNSLPHLMEYIKDQIKKRGLPGLISLGIRFKSQDHQKSHFINNKKFYKVFKQAGIQIRQDQSNEIFHHFDRNRQGFINYAQFIYSIRGTLSVMIKQLLQTLFNSLCGNQLRLETLKQAFYTNYQHGQVIRQQFLDCIRLYNDFQGIDDGIFTDEDFLDFMGFVLYRQQSEQKNRQWIINMFNMDKRVSRSQKGSRRQFYHHEQNKSPPLSELPCKNNQDETFKKKQVIHYKPHEEQYNKQPKQYEQQYKPKSYNQQSVKSYKSKERQKSPINKINYYQNKPQNIDRYQKYTQQSKKESRKTQSWKSDLSTIQIKQIQFIILRIKNRLSSRGTRGFLNFHKALKAIDIDNDNLINLQQFRKVIKDLRIDITDLQIQSVFDLFDDQMLGRIQIQQVYDSLKGEVSMKRREMIDRVWKQIDKHNQGQIPFGLLKNIVNARAHPDVKNGRRHEDDVLKQLFQSIIIIKELRGQQSQLISQSNVKEFLDNLSASIPDQNLFENILTTFFRLGSEIRIEEMYAGSRKYFDVNQKNGYLLDHHRHMINGGSVSNNAPYGTFDQPTLYSGRPYH